MVTTRHGAITDPNPQPENQRVLIDPHPVPNHHIVKSVAEITNKFQMSIKVLAQKNLYQNDLSSKLMENA